MALQIRKRPFSTVELQKAAGCARDTLYKHADIWRQEYEDLAAGFFAACPDEYNAVEDTIPVSEEFVSAPVFKEEIPIGLIAARQVVFELSQKGRKETAVRENPVLKTRADLDEGWRQKVAGLTQGSPLELSTVQLKARLYVLANLLSLAPYEEDAMALLPYVQQIRREYNRRCNGPGGLALERTGGQTDSS